MIGLCYVYYLLCGSDDAKFVSLWNKALYFSMGNSNWHWDELNDSTSTLACGILLCYMSWLSCSMKGRPSGQGDSDCSRVLGIIESWGVGGVLGADFWCVNGIKAPVGDFVISIA